MEFPTADSASAFHPLVFKKENVTMDFKLLLGLSVLCFANLLYAQLPDEFNDQRLPYNFEAPMGIVFDSDGRMFVWEKEGKVHIVDTLGNRLPDPLIDISEEVSNWKDHGLMGFTLDRDFLINGHFYLLYALDLHHYYHFGTPAYHPDSTVTFKPTIGRVTRYTADPATGFSTTLPGSRQVLLGETLLDGIPLLYEFHGLGSLITGDDGTLLISSGDGTGNLGADIGGDQHGTFASAAIEAGIITPDQDIGSYRAQYLGNLNGKILRIDPHTGDGLSSNPFFDPAHPRAQQSRVWAYGFRNPYRIVLRPESGSHYPEDGMPGIIYVGDVGNGAWEEINVVTEGGQNFGWPVFEGLPYNWAFYFSDVPYNQSAPNPLYGINGCDKPFFTFRDLIAEPMQGVTPLFHNPCDTIPIPESAFPRLASLPAIVWSNSRWNQPTRAIVSFFNENGSNIGIELDDPESPVQGENFDGFSSLAGVFYTGKAFPEEYRGKFFGLDFSGWIKVFDFDENDELIAVHPFHDNAANIIHMTLNPADECIYYVNLDGDIRKISFGGNPPPVAIIKTDRNYGPGPLAIQFDASDSYDSNLPLVSYEWDFGDGAGSFEIQPSHTFHANGNAPQSFTVTLTVTDSLGATATDSKIISLNNTPPSVRITSFEEGDRYSLDGTYLLILEADVFDEEHPDETLTYEWRTFLHHNDHFHPEPTINDHRSYALISPLGCSDNEIYWYRIELIVTDPAGLSGKDSRRIFPYCDDPFITSLELTTFPEQDRNLLFWTAKAERELQDFHIQRSSNFLDFQTISYVSAIPDVGIGHSYQFIDNAPLHGVNIYRIKAVEKERAFTYSNLSSVVFPPDPEIRLFPNPSRGTFQVALGAARSELVQFELFNQTGIRIFNATWPSDFGQPLEKTITAGHLSSGVYYYRVVNGARSYAGRIAIVK
jgi:glucose/arabinose dehydrogenase